MNILLSYFPIVLTQVQKRSSHQQSIGTQKDACHKAKLSQRPFPMKLPDQKGAQAQYTCVQKVLPCLKHESLLLCFILFSDWKQFVMFKNPKNDSNLLVWEVLWVVETNLFEGVDSRFPLFVSKLVNTGDVLFLEVVQEIHLFISIN